MAGSAITDTAQWARAAAEYRRFPGYAWESELAAKIIAV
jgi:hypothetical protein